MLGFNTHNSRCEWSSNSASGIMCLQEINTLQHMEKEKKAHVSDFKIMQAVHTAFTASACTFSSSFFSCKSNGRHRCHIKQCQECDKYGSWRKSATYWCFVRGVQFIENVICFSIYWLQVVTWAFFGFLFLYKRQEQYRSFFRKSNQYIWDNILSAPSFWTILCHIAFKQKNSLLNIPSSKTFKFFLMW